MSRPLRPIRWGKTYKNRAENAFAEMAKEAGWLVTKTGYPDFICYRGDEIIFVEVKSKKSHRLKSAQLKFADHIRRYGVKCYRWSPDKPWTPYPLPPVVD